MLPKGSYVVCLSQQTDLTCKQIEQNDAYCMKNRMVKWHSGLSYVASERQLWLRWKGSYDVSETQL